MDPLLITAYLTHEGRQKIVNRCRENQCWNLYEQAVELLLADAYEQWRVGFAGNATNKVLDLEKFARARTGETPAWWQQLKLFVQFGTDGHGEASDFETLWNEQQNSDAVRFRALLALLAKTGSEEWLERLGSVAVPPFWEGLLLFLSGRKPPGGNWFERFDQLRQGNGTVVFGILDRLSQHEVTRRDVEFWKTLLCDVAESHIRGWQGLRLFWTSMRAGRLNEFQNQGYQWFKGRRELSMPIDFMDPFDSPRREVRFVLLTCLACVDGLSRDPQMFSKIGRELFRESLLSPKGRLRADSPLPQHPYVLHSWDGPLAFSL